MPELNLNQPLPNMDNSNSIPSTPGVKELDLSQPLPEDKGMIHAAAQGIFHGIDTVATSFLKLLNTPLKNEFTGQDLAKPQLDPNAIQSTYNTNTEAYKAEHTMHPVAATLGNIAGQTAAYAPLMALPGVEGASATSIAGIGKLGLQAASNAAQGALIGGLTSQEGQNPNQVWNYGNATNQALWSIPLGMASNVVGNFLGKTSQLEAAQNAAKEAGYTGKVLAADLPSQGIIDNMHSWVTNSVLSKLPSIMGTNGARTQQNADINAAIQNYIKGISSDTLQNTTTKIGNILDNHDKQLKDTYNTLWQNFTSQLPNTPIDRPNSLPLLRSMLDDPNQVQALITSKNNNEFQALRQGLQASTPEDIFRFKNDAWNIYQRLTNLSNKGILNPGQDTLKDNAIALYHASIDDMKNGIQNTLNKSTNDLAGNYFISAEQAALSPQQNAQRTQQLINYFKQNNIPYKSVNGVYKGTSENSFMIPEQGNSNLIKQLQQQYGQETYLHSTSTGQNLLKTGDNVVSDLGSMYKSSIPPNPSLTDGYSQIGNNFYSNITSSQSALHAYEAARTFTIPYKQLFDNRPQLANAIADINNQQNGISDFIKWTLAKDTNPGMVSDAQKMLGQSGSNAVAGYGLKELYNKSLDNVNGRDVFNISKFLGGIKDMDQSNQSQLYKPALEGMQGLTNVMQQYADAMGSKVLPTQGKPLLKTAEGLAPFVLGGAAAHATGVPALIGALGITPAIMSTIAKSSPIKNSLIYINRATGNPGITQYYLNKLNEQFVREGLIVTNDDNGNTILHKQGE